MNSTHRPALHGTMVGVDPGGRAYSGPYEDLAAAIVMQAVKDYVNLIKSLWLGEGKDRKKKQKILLEKIELEAFFHSPWYEMLTDINPESLIARCELLGKQQARETIMAANKRQIAREKDMAADAMDAVDAAKKEQDTEEENTQ